MELLFDEELPQEAESNLKNCKMVINIINTKAIKKIRFNLSANIFLGSEVKNEIIRLIVNKIEEIKKADGRRNIPNLNKYVP